MPTLGVPTLGNLKEVTVDAGYRQKVTITMPMPRLERLRINNAGGDTDAESDEPAVVLGSAAGGAALFPALTRLELTTDNLSLHVASMPTLRTMSLVPRDRRVACDLRDATQLTSLRLQPNTLTLSDFEMAPYLPYAGNSNFVAKTLRRSPPSLRVLDLTITEPMDAQIEGAIRALTGLTCLDLLLHSLGPSPRRFDCRLLAGMLELQELHVHSGALRNRGALASLPALRVFEHIED